MKKCKVCGELTDTVFNINLKATPICEECARRIFLQQATWYTQQEFKNLALPQVSKCEEFEREALLKLKQFVANQKDLPDDINQIVNDNFWELF